MGGHADGESLQPGAREQRHVAGHSPAQDERERPGPECGG